MSNEGPQKGHASDRLHAVLTDVFRDHRARIVSYAAGAARDLDVAEESVQEAFAAAAEQWPLEGVPRNPAAWIARVARRRAIDRIRRESWLERSHLELDVASAEALEPADDAAIADDRLRLIFTCCHPSLGDEAQVALTLRIVCGLSVDAIARAFGVSSDAVSKRLVRARAKIRDARIPYEVPERAELPARLAIVLRVLYLVFTVGYDIPTPKNPLDDLAAEAMRLARALRELLGPDCSSEVLGLLALMLLHDARRATRFDAAGQLILLQDQDRSRWNQNELVEGLALVELALTGWPGSYALQAAIAALHCQASTYEATDWRQIVALYDALLTVDPSPFIRLNRAAAFAMVEGAQAALHEIDALGAALDSYRVYHSARAALLDQTGAHGEAQLAYRRAMQLTDLPSERQFLAGRLRGYADSSPSDLP